jgi:hypothetical protein
MIDIHLSSLNRSAGQILPDLPGLFAATPPKRTARGRDRDALMIHLSPIGTDEALSANRIADLLNAAAERFYKSAGSITSALTEAADFLNTYFIDINKNLYPSKAPCTAGLNILVIRGDLFFNACAGQSACLIVRPGEWRNSGEIQPPKPVWGWAALCNYASLNQRYSPGIFSSFLL